MFVIDPQTSNPKSFKQGCGKHETIRNLKSKSLLDALVSVWEDSVCTTYHFLSDEEILKIKIYIPQVVAHHVDAHFLHGLLVLNTGWPQNVCVSKVRFRSCAPGSSAPRKPFWMSPAVCCRAVPWSFGNGWSVSLFSELHILHTCKPIPAKLEITNL